MTTIGLGGNANYYLSCKSVDDIKYAMNYAKVNGLKIQVMAGGSNIIFPDEGFEGLVIKIDIKGISVTENDDHFLVGASAGESWDEFVQQIVYRGLTGIECLSGIPGSVGATPIQNVGAYGQDVSETISQVATLDTIRSSPRTFSAEECQFSYRDSWFKSREPGRYIVTEVTFRLRPNAPPALRYVELERHFLALGNTAPTLSELRQAVLQLRREKSMLLDESDANGRSCGSFFLNPVLSNQQFQQFLARAEGLGNLPQFPQADGRVKLSAGWLIEQAGFPRGTRDGQVGLSTKHALALVAHAGARADDVTRLARRVQLGVLERFGVQLEPEPVFWGNGQPTLA